MSFTAQVHQRPLPPPNADICVGGGWAGVDIGAGALDFENVEGRFCVWKKVKGGPPVMEGAQTARASIQKKRRQRPGFRVWGCLGLGVQCFVSRNFGVGLDRFG